MEVKEFWVCLAIVILRCISCECILLIVPEDVSTGLAAVYGFSPRFIKGNDHRVGFGFQFGNHADFQVLYEFGPQVYTKPLKPISK
ncbi:uncharacterized protein LOC113232264 [Hyposmocoma kahamanoa]|uniref:uncharacterized protein LOC113232264 n=1 Tax=Hyposmocoma kahamanoa TaxID=1477025 RepID=UPI000E6D9604|nr:uncharacterized protein LOC113232264 [Hyposmocoma kahamanoa]